MKTIYTLLVVLLTSTFHSSLHAQRYIPLLEEGQSLNDYVYDQAEVYDMEIYDDKLVFVGNFTSFNGQEMNSIGYWNGTNYEPFPVQLEGEYEILDVLNTPLGLVISGNFAAGEHIKLFNGTEWVSMGDGFDNQVNDIIWYQDKLYACGEFDFSGGNSVNHFAVFDSETWQEVGEGLNNDAYVMIEFEGELFIAGQFTGYGDLEINTVAKWDGVDLFGIENDFSGIAESLAVFNDELYVGFSFNFGNEKLVKLTEEGFEYISFEDVSQPDGIRNLQSISEGLIIQDKYLLTLDGVLTEPSFLPCLGEVVFFQGERIACTTGPAPDGLESDYYITASLGRLRHGGKFQETINTNQIQTEVLFSGFQFLNRSNSRANYFVDPFESVSPIYSAGPWIGGVTQDNNIQMSAATYFGDNSVARYYSGPMSSNYDNNYLDKYLRVWKVSALEIENHLVNYSNSDYIMPEAIQYWPGNGRVEYGESSHLAPFVDANQNGWYEPELGDYPDIRGDVAVFNLLSGSRRGAYEEGETKLEIGVMTYGYLTDGAEIDQTLFVRHTILNDSDEDFTDFKFGYWMDGDLGSAIDDHVGCSPERDIYYCYNGDSFDESSSGSFGYGSNCPAQGVKFLNRSMSSHLYYNNSTGQNGEPVTNGHYWNYMNSIWKDGTPLTFGGDGYQTGNDPDNPTNFMFPTNPGDNDFDPEDWNEITAGNSPGDRRQIGATESMTLAAGEKICVELALITAFAGESDNSNIESVQVLLDKADQVQAFYDAQAENCFPETFPLGIEDASEVSAITIYP
ncbi:MAG: hypothetical protein AB8B53_13300, partial [Flavobacteriales bacterium]